MIALPTRSSGPRILLRPYARTIGALFEAVDSRAPSVGGWMPWVKRVPLRRRCRGHRAAAAGQVAPAPKNLIVGIFDRQTGQLRGGSGLNRIDWTIPRFEIGYWLRASAVGQGYVTETVQVLTRFAFDHLAANRVEIRMDVRDPRSRAVPERLAFAYEGCLRRSLPDVHAQPGDAAVFALTREDYNRLPWREAPPD